MRSWWAKQLIPREAKDMESEGAVAEDPGAGLQAG